MDAENQQSKSARPRPSRLLFGKNPKVTLIRLILTVTLLFIVTHFIVLLKRVEGVSMSPLYPPGKIVFINKLAYINHEPQRGDVVGIRTTGESIIYFKRIVGLPGETISIVRGDVYVDGIKLDEPYAKKRKSWNLPKRTLAQGVSPEFFFIGDNRSMRQSWHYFGVGKGRKIIGKVF